MIENTARSRGFRSAQNTPMRIAMKTAMRISLLILTLAAAASLQWRPRPQQCHGKAERLRQELAGVQMELMDVMRTDSGTTSCLRNQEERLKYDLRAEEIVTASASASMAASSASLNGPSGASPEPKQPQSTCIPRA